MSLDVVDAACQKVVEAGLLGSRVTVLFHAGEPTVPGIDYYRQVIKLIRDRIPDSTRITFSMQTNGTLIDQDWCDFIKTHDLKVGISIDGPQPLHDRHRVKRNGQGSYAETIRAVNLFKKNDIPLRTISVLTADSLREPDMLFDFFFDLGVDICNFNIEEVEGIHRTSTAYELGETDTIRRFFQRFFQRWHAAGKPMRVREINKVLHVIRQFDVGKNDAIRRKQQTTPYRVLTVGGNGDFSTFSPELLGAKSPNYRHFVFGNVLTDSLESALRSPHFLRCYEDIQKGLQRCQRTCSYYGVCGGGIPSNKVAEHDTFDADETQLCRLYIRTVTDAVIDAMEAVC